jgi:hypothetical protein
MNHKGEPQCCALFLFLANFHTAAIKKKLGKLGRTDKEVWVSGHFFHYFIIRMVLIMVQPVLIYSDNSSYEIKEPN